MKHIKLFEQWDDPFGEEELDNDPSVIKCFKKIYIHPLPVMNKMEQLQCDCSDLHTLNGIENFPNLKDLNISGGGLRTLDGIEILKDLEQLICNYNLSLTDLKPLSNLLKLRNLDMHGNNITSLEDISNLKLRYINVSNNKNLLNLDGLNGENLRSLSCAGCGLTDIEELFRFKNLKEMWCVGNNFSEKDLDKIRQYCSDNYISGMGKGMFDNIWKK